MFLHELSLSDNHYKKLKANKNIQLSFVRKQTWPVNNEITLQVVKTNRFRK